MTDLASSAPLSSFNSYRRKQALTAIVQELHLTAHPPHRRLAAVDPADLAAAVRVLRDLEPRADPSVVFTTLAQLLVPAVCDTATAAVQAGSALGGMQPERLPSGNPPVARVRSDGTGWTMTLRTPVLRLGEDGPPTVAVLTCGWLGPAPTAQQLAVVELAAGYAALLVDQTRQSELLSSAQRQVESLRVALDSNRIIGAAVGVLMATRQLTYPAAFDLMVGTSQQVNRKLAAVADEVLHTGCLPVNP